MLLPIFTESLNHADYMNFKCEIQTKCKVSRAAISYWFTGKLEPSYKNRIIINSISNQLFNTTIYDNL